MQHDDDTKMVFGALWCDADKTRKFSQDIAAIQRKYINRSGKNGRLQEFKWSKLSPSNVLMYKEIVEYFFHNDDLHFRAVVAPKGDLDHPKYGQTHSDFYYKMYFLLISKVLSSENMYKVFLDIRDTHSKAKADELRTVLCNDRYDFARETLEVQVIRSDESKLMQLADILIGAVSYVNRDPNDSMVSAAKMNILKLIQEKSGKSLQKNTHMGESKVNILIWKSKGLH